MAQEETLAKPQDYAWTPQNKLSIKDFTKEYLPSKTTKEDASWIWVQSTPGPFIDPEIHLRQEEAVQSAKYETDQLFDRLLEIDNDENAPPRPEGYAMTKGDLKKQAHDRTVHLLKVIMFKSGWLSGKWLWRSNHEAVDDVWAKIACSVVSGPLKEVGVTMAKVETGVDGIYLYVLNVFDVDTLVKILETLISCHGIVPAGVKPDLYTAAGITSQHPAKIDSLVFRPRDHPLGMAEVTKLIKEFEEYETIFGTGSRADVFSILDDVDITSSPTIVASSPRIFVPHVELGGMPIRLKGLLKDMELRAIKPLPLRFKCLITLEPFIEPRFTPSNVSKNLMKDFERASGLI